MQVTSSRSRFALAGLIALGGFSGCVDSSERGAAAQESRGGDDAPGALIRLEMNSTTAVLLDEIPAGPARELAAANALTRGDQFWIDRAKRQAHLTFYHLVFRAGYYAAAERRGPLPLPPESVWNISLRGRAHRMRHHGHDVVAIDYSFQSHILTDLASPATVEPALVNIHGTWDEPFTLPVDPELLLERTGYACMDELEYPRGSVFEENTYYFYDDQCGVETPATSGCHITRFPTESCADALSAHVGSVSTRMRFTRLPWDATLASRVRVGTITNPTGADLAVVTEDMVRENRVIYRYFGPGSCEQVEGVIGQLGWRRLLTFSATVRNDGAQPIHIGDVTDPTGPWQLAHVFEYSPCHMHYHFSHYGNFNYNGAPGSKRAFCLEDTNRFHNDERTPLAATHQSCAYQGITQGWGDEYEFGLPGQWVDITDVDATRPHDLVFDSNADHFLCEGVPALDASGVPIFDPSEFTNSSGLVVGRERCAMPPTWHNNNVGRVSYSTPAGGYVTEPCTRGQTGPLRSCGFNAQPAMRSCTPGATVRLRCETRGVQVVRACERSQALGVGVACTVGDSLANAVVGDDGAVVSFTCPALRDGAAGTGGYALYEAPVSPALAGAAVRCTAL